MSILTLLKKMRATALLLAHAKEVDRKHPILILRQEVEGGGVEKMIADRRHLALGCRCETCHEYLKAVARYDGLMPSDPDIVAELPNPSKENER